MAEQLYAFVNTAILPFWLLLIVAPRSKMTAKVVHSVIFPITMAVFYLVCLTIGLTSATLPDTANPMTLSGLMQLFTSPWGVLAGWTHYLIFDLFVGAWISRDAARRGYRHWFVAPALVLTLLMGPIGLAGYLAGRSIFAGASADVSEISPNA